MRGKFIVFEGCEGVGKSTQLRLIKEYLASSGQDVVFTREPGGTPLAEKIREIILTQDMTAECEAALFAAARADHIDNLLMPALESGKTIICDRYIDSSFAYQGFGRGLGYEKVAALNSYALNTCMPDAVLFIDMNPLSSWRRQKGKTVDNDRLEREKDDFHLRVYDGFKSLSEKFDRYVPIVPDVDKLVTGQKIIDALRSRGVIR